LDYSYQGSELQVFAQAKNWKSYFTSLFDPCLSGNILEVGAGNGGTTPYLLHKNVSSCLCLEPDAVLAESIRRKILLKELPGICSVMTGTIDTLPADRHFNAILYIDVLEHIENDRAEIGKALLHLEPGGYLIILVPAHQWLFSEFDQHVGHYRRYNQPGLQILIPEKLRTIKIYHLDSSSLIVSSVQKLFLKAKIPTRMQIEIWDKYFVSISRITDRLCFFSTGKSILGIWKKE
jgi:hypothetical protein